MLLTTRTTGQTKIIRLSHADQKRFARTLLSPPKPNDALTRAFRRRSNMLFPVT